MEFYDMQRTIDGIERQRLLTNWLLKCTPHMATPSRISDCRPTAAAQASAVAAAATTLLPTTITANPEATVEGNYNNQHSSVNKCGPVKMNRKYGSKDGGNVVMNAMNILKVRNKGAGVQVVHQPVKNRLKFLSKSKPTGGGPYITVGTNANTHIQRHHGLHSVGENRRAKLRRFISHVSNTNTFSVADFENARLARRNEIELKQRLQRCNGKASNSKNNDWFKIRITEGGGTLANLTLEDVSSNNNNNNVVKHNHEMPNVRLYIEEFLEQYNLPRIVRIFYNSKLPKKCSIYRNENGPQTIISAKSKTKTTITATSASITSITNPDNTNVRCVSSMQTMGSSTSSSNNSSNVTKTSNSCLNGSHSNDSNNNHGTDDEEQGEVLLLYRMVQHRHIYHAYNAKTTASNRKKGILIPQEFPGYFSQINSKGVPTATQYTSVIQLVRERVCKFISLDNMPAFTECHFNDNDRSGNISINVPKANYTTTNRPQYTKTTAKGGQVFKLLAVYEDDKQDQNSLGVTISCVSLGNSKQHNSNGREKDRCRYAQLLNEQRQTIYVSLATKGKFYEVEPGIPQLFQKHLANEGLNKINLDCVHRITALINSKQKLPIILRYISGPANCTNLIPDNISVYHITTEDVIISCPIENVEMQTPLYLLKLHINSGLQLMKTNLGFESEQRMLANHNVQNILKFCQFNCDQFLRIIEVENLNQSPNSNSNGKSRKEGLKILKPLQISNLLRREKSQMLPTHEKEDSIIFLTKSHLANLVNNKKTNFDQHTNRLTNKMKVFQSSRRNWFRKQDPKAFNCLDDITLGIQAKRMSIERYTDMSKLMQERFGDKLNSIDSNIGNSNTRRNTYEETADLTKFNTNSSIIPKSISLQDIDSTINSSYKMDTNTSSAASGIAATSNQQTQQNSFITEKLYNEFHVKTRQYSKSFTNVNQLLNFSPPQKLNINENKINKNPINRQEVLKECVANGSGTTDCLNSITSSLIDDLPYSNVRDSLIVSSGDSSSLDIPATSNLFQTLHLIDYTKENIYAEICHDVGNTNVPTDRDAAVTSITNHSPIDDLADESGEYATLLYTDAGGVSGSNANSDCCSSDAGHPSRPSAITTSVVQHMVQLPVKHTTTTRFTNGAAVKAESSGHITRVNVVDISRKDDANK